MHALAPDSMTVNFQSDEHFERSSSSVALGFKLSKHVTSTTYYYVHHKRAWQNCKDIVICTEIVWFAILVKDLGFNIQPFPRLCFEAF